MEISNSQSEERIVGQIMQVESRPNKLIRVKNHRLQRNWNALFIIREQIPIKFLLNLDSLLARTRDRERN